MTGRMLSWPVALLHGDLQDTTASAVVYEIRC